EAFRQAWTYLRDQFFDDKMNGVDWNAVRAAYEPRVAGARTPDEMRRIISLMLGELNASHMGIAAPPQGNQNTVGRLAADFVGAGPRSDRQADRSTDGEGAPLPTVGGRAPRVCREGQRRQAWVRPHVRHVGGGARATPRGSRCGKSFPAGCGRRRTQQQRRVR